MDWSQFSAEQLQEFARQASQQAQGRLQGTQAPVKEEDLEVISLGSDDGSEDNGRNDSQAEDSGEDTEKTERKRKRDPDTPRKPKRPPPGLRDDYSPSQHSRNDSGSTTYSTSPSLPTSGKSFTQTETEGDRPVAPRRSRAAKDKAGSDIRGLYEMTRTADWTVPATSSAANAKSSASTATSAQPKPSHNPVTVDAITPTVTRAVTPALFQDAKLPRFIPRLNIGQDVVSAVKEAFQKVKTDELSEHEKRLYQYTSDRRLRLFLAADRCDGCRKKDAGHTKPPPTGMQRLPCLSWGDGRPCVVCTLGRTGCSFTSHIEGEPRTDSEEAKDNKARPTPEVAESSTSAGSRSKVASASVEPGISTASESQSPGPSRNESLGPPKFRDDLIRFSGMVEGSILRGSAGPAELKRMHDICLDLLKRC